MKPMIPNTATTESPAHTKNNIFADVSLYLDALRFTNTVSRSREEYEQRAIEEAALKKIGRAEVGNDIEI